MSRTSLVVSAAAGVLAISAGAAVALASNDNAEPASSSSSLATGSPVASTSSGSSVPSVSGSPAADRLTAADASRVAVTRVDGTVHEVEREFEHGRDIWEVEIFKDGVEYEVDVDAVSGTVTRVETDD